jgi:hypothetical protein
MLRYIIIKSSARWMSSLLGTNPAWAYCVRGLLPLSKYVAQYWARMASQGFFNPSQLSKKHIAAEFLAKWLRRWAEVPAISFTPHRTL